MLCTDKRDREGIMRIGRICGLALQHMLAHVQPGISTLELDEIGAAFLRQHHAISAPMKAYNFPAWTCISVNDEVAHGVPSHKRVIKAGDVVNIDVSAVLDGYWADTGATVLVPPAKSAHVTLCQATINALHSAIASAKAGVPVYEIGRTIEAHAKRGGYRVFRELGGHGVGRHIHEEPSVYNYFTRQASDKLVNGLVLTVEPFFNLGRGRLYTAKDKWTLKSVDRSISAQYEHTIIIQDDNPILCTRVEGGH